MYYIDRYTLSKCQDSIEEGIEALNTLNGTFDDDEDIVELALIYMRRILKKVKNLQNRELTDEM